MNEQDLQELRNLLRLWAQRPQLAKRVQLLTNNPEKVNAVREAGIQVVDRRPLFGTLNRHNLRYVKAKSDRAGHWLDEMLAGGAVDK